MTEDLKRCSKCKVEKLMINFQKDNKQKHGFYHQCKVCRKPNYIENLVKIKKILLRQSRTNKRLLFKISRYNKKNIN